MTHLVPTNLNKTNELSTSEFFLSSKLTYGPLPIMGFL